MEKKLLDSLTAALRGVGVTNGAEKFSAKDVNEQAIVDLREAIGAKADTPISVFRSKREEVFEIISEALDEILPKELGDILGGFAEVKTFARNAEVEFELKGQGLRRARLTIQKGARGGIYRAARIDSRYMGLDTEVETVGVYVSLEDILSGDVTFGELYQNILTGFEDRIFGETVAALRTAETLAPASHTFTAAGFDAVTLDHAIGLASAYGDQVIVLGFQNFVSKITNLTPIAGANPNISQEDANDVRRYGFVQLYKGTQVIKLPNYVLKDAATYNGVKWAYSENELFVLPGAIKPVKIALKGDMYIQDNKNADGSEGWDAHKMVGVGLLLADNICIVKDSTIAAVGQY